MPVLIAKGSNFPNLMMMDTLHRLQPEVSYYCYGHFVNDVFCMIG